MRGDIKPNIQLLYFFKKYKKKGHQKILQQML